VKLKSRLIVAIPAAVALAVAGGLIWRYTRTPSTASLLQRLPTQNAAIVSIDFDALRRDGILQMLENSKVGEDVEYRNFVRQTNFNYQRDLDSAVAAFAPTGKFLLLRGRFDWKALAAYVAAQGGKCDADLCRMQGSTPERHISFFPLGSHLMAMAVSPDDSAALRLRTATTSPVPALPDGPVWVSIPIAALQSGESLPDGTRAFARTLSQAETLTISLAPDGRRLAARMTVVCRNEMDAADAALQLTHVTDLLRQMIARERQKPNPNDLSGVLTAGSFRPDGRRVLGYWPIERAFLESMLGGGR